MVIVFVHIGSALPWYLSTALHQARLFSADPIILLANRDAMLDNRPARQDDITLVPIEDLGRSRNWQAIERVAIPNENSFSNGYWRKTLERFFALESLMAVGGLRDIIQLETDVMLYADPDGLRSGFNAGAPLAVPFGSPDHAVPGIFYARNAQALVDFTGFALDQIATTGQPGVAETPLTDMFLLGAFHRRRPGKISALPVLPPDYRGEYRNPGGGVAIDSGLFSNAYSDFQGVFDANALGMNFLGRDPRYFASGPGLCPLSTYNYGQYSLSFSPDRHGRLCPALRGDGQSWPVYSIHVHDKALTRVQSQPPLPATPRAPCSYKDVKVPTAEMITPSRLAALADCALAGGTPPLQHQLIVEPVGAHDGSLSVTECARLERQRSVALPHDRFVGYLRDVFANNITRPQVWLLPGNDYRITETLRPLLHDPRVIACFASNVEISDPKVIPWPFGVADDEKMLTDIGRLNNAPSERIDRLLIDFQIDDNAAIRAPIVTALGNRPFVTLQPNQHDLTVVARHRWRLCPPGRNVDTAAIWEAIYLGTIPVVLASTIVAHFETLPILVAENNDVITSEWLVEQTAQLRTRRFDLSPLHLSYWAELVRQRANQA